MRRVALLCSVLSLSGIQKEGQTMRLEDRCSISEERRRKCVDGKQVTASCISVNRRLVKPVIKE